MSGALAEALVAAQRRAVSVLEKAYVAGAFEDDLLRSQLDAMGCVDAVDQTYLVHALDVLRVYGGTTPSEPRPNGDAPASVAFAGSAGAGQVRAVALSACRPHAARGGRPARDAARTYLGADRVVEGWHLRCERMGRAVLSLGGTIKCPVCGRPYKWYAHYAGDQSACPACRSEAEQSFIRPDGPRERERRRRFFDGD